ncbi:MAG TPA: ParB/RepB/Spo0J family partition protein [Acidimicrobiales bacterium]|nr:ParB/RepB/Spo0J family partition protein [Acidimicrobiales bacterium]
MYKNLPIDLVRPAEDNLRRRTGSVADIVATIPTHGIIEPLVVTPRPDGTYLIVAGHRRHAAARKAGLETLPCVVRTMSDDERILAALVENGLRNDLRPTEEAAGYFRLVEAGWRIKDLAAATGRSSRHVSTRLALLELPAEIRSALDGGRIGVAEAAELLRLKAHPQILAEVAAEVAGDESLDVGVTVRRALAGAERSARRAAVLERLGAEGVAAVDHDGYGIPAGLRLLGADGGVDVDAADHAGEPCHVLIVNADAEQRPACNDPGRHAARGASGLKAAPAPARSVPDGDAERRAQQAALREAAARRAEFEAELLGRRLAKSSVEAFVLETLVRSANQAPAKAALRLLGLAAPDDDTAAPVGRAADELMAQAAGGPAQLQRVALALAFALAEEYLGTSWGAIGWASPTAVAHLRFLDDHGYQRSEFEDQRLAEAADALEEREAQRRRWLDQPATDDTDSDGATP